MPSYPAAVSTVTVTGTYRWADAQAIAPIGAVSFIPSETLQDAADNVILAPVAVVCPLVDNGNGSSSFTTTLMATDDPYLQPTGWVYQVKESVGGSIRTYDAQFPAGGPYDLADITPALPDPMFSYVLLASVGTVGGPAGPLDSNGLIPTGQIPGGGGGGTPSSTVVTETSYGQSSTAGAATAYSRGDHTHGTPAAPTAGSVGAQPLDSDLTALAGLTATTDNVIQSVAGAWASRTPAQVKTTLALAKGDVGLGNVDNTSDVNKPVSTAQAAADAVVAAASQPLDTGLTSFAALTGAGFVVATATDAMVMRTLVAGSTAVVVANGTGAAGNPSVDLNTLLKAIGALAGNGIVAQTAPGTAANRSIAATDSSIVVVNGDGVSGNPSLSAKLYVDTGSFGTPVAVNASGGSFGTNVSAGTPAPTAQNGPGARTYLAGALLLAASQVFGANSVLATLPTAQRPAALGRWTVRTIGSNTQTVIAVDTDGTIKNLSSITAGGSGDTLALDPVNFVHA